MSFICNLCNKDFLYKCKLVRHQNNKRACNVQLCKKIVYECDVCGYRCTFKSLLDRHQNSNKCRINHITYNNTINNIDNSVNYINNINNNINLTLQINGFSETSLESLFDSKFNCYIGDDNVKQSVLKLNNDDTFNKNLILRQTFKTVIEIFKDLNFNLAYSRNHNCKIFLFHLFHLYIIKNLDSLSFVSNNY